MSVRIIEKTLPVPIHNDIGSFTLIGYLVSEGRHVETHLALIYGDPHGSVPVRINSACLTSEVFHDDRCDCAWQLDEALRRFTALGQGVLFYHPNHEGRGIGILRKIESYNLMTLEGMTTSEAFAALGEPQDSRNYQVAVELLRDLGISKVRLLSNNPEKAVALEEAKVQVESIEEIVGVHNPKWHHYLRSKAVAFNHKIYIPETSGNPVSVSDKESI